MRCLCRGFFVRGLRHQRIVQRRSEDALSCTSNERPDERWWAFPSASPGPSHAGRYQTTALGIKGKRLRRASTRDVPSLWLGHSKFGTVCRENTRSFTSRHTYLPYVSSCRARPWSRWCNNDQNEPSVPLAWCTGYRF